MKPHPNIRKTVKWAGAAASVLMLGAWLGSARWYVSWEGAKGDSVSLLAGRLVLEREHTGSTNLPAAWYFGHRRFQLALRPDWSFGQTGWWVTIPLWIPLAPTLAATATAWRADALARRRARIGRCPICNYDRRDIPAEMVCPECGAAPPTPAGG